MLSKPPQLRAFWHQYRLPVSILTGLIFLDLVISFINLTSWPIFADEAIYIRWAQVMRAEPTLRFLPLTDGKQPLFMWVMIPFLKLIQDPLLAGRTLSILAGISTLIGIYFLATHLFKSTKHGLIAAILYLIVPYTFFFNRFALVDSFLCSLFVWSCFFAIKNIANPRLDLAMITGISIGAAWLTKSPAIYLFVIVPAVVLIEWKKILKQPWHIVRWTVTCIISFSISLVIYNLLRLGPEFHQIGLRNVDYILPLSEVLQNPFNSILPNAADWLSFYWYLLTPGLVMITLVGGFKLFKTQPALVGWLLIWIFIPTISQLLFARTLTARYLLFTIPPVLLFATYGTVFMLQSRQVIIRLIVGLIALHILIIDGLMITSPTQVPLPRRERSGYLEEWTAGVGLRDIAAFLQTQTDNHLIVVGTEGYFGTTPDGLQIYFNTDPRVRIVGQSHQLDKIPEGLYQALDQNRVFLVINDERFHVQDPTALGLKLLQSHPKAVRPDGTQQTMQLFEIIHRP